MEEKTLLQVFISNAREFPADTILKYKKEGGTEYSDVSWSELKDTVMDFACGLVAVGMEPGDRLAILSANRYEWIITDLGTIMAGGSDIPIYHTSTADQCAYILKDSGSEFVVVEDEEQLEKIISRLDTLPKIKKIILIHGDTSMNEKVLSYSELLRLGRENIPRIGEEILRSALSISPEIMATIVYTSGTTGPPKGCMVSHGNIVYVLNSIDNLLQIDTGNSLSLMVLPLSHFYPRISGYYYNIYKGVPFAIAESIDTLSRNMVETRPTYFTSVPRIFEKVYARILAAMEDAPIIKRKLFTTALQIGKKRSRVLNSGKKVSPLLAFSFMLVDLLVFKKIRNLLGGKLEFAVSAGAPLSADVGEFIHSIGIQVIEFYGLTETLGGTMTTFDKCRYGTVGMAMPGFDVKIADDGEILIRGNNFMGYCNKPGFTRDMIRDGWCYTGDIGYFDEDGFLVINDRKKELIVTSGGKKISPQQIENMLKKIPLVSNAMVYGDNKNYLTAIITLDREDTQQFCERNNIHLKNSIELNSSGEIRDVIQKGIDSVNDNLAKFETIKIFTILPGDFSQEEGEITPTLKIKRKVITERYRHEIEAMYASNS
jgi:long-chain acyl-CoA synthetase